MDTQDTQKIKVTREQLGQHLFDLVQKTVTHTLNEAEHREQLGLNSLSDETDRVLRELFILNMFVVVQMFQGLLDNKTAGTQVLDAMHKAYYSYMAKLPTAYGTAVRALNEHNHLLLRYEEYQVAMEEKIGPNWLWPLTRHMLNNLHGREVKSAVTTISLTVQFVSLMNVIPEFVNAYELNEEINKPTDVKQNDQKKAVGVEELSYCIYESVRRGLTEVQELSSENILRQLGVKPEEMIPQQHIEVFVGLLFIASISILYEYSDYKTFKDVADGIRSEFLKNAREQGTVEQDLIQLDSLFLSRYKQYASFLSDGPDQRDRVWQDIGREYYYNIIGVQKENPEAMARAVRYLVATSAGTEGLLKGFRLAR